jgi:hypothetical protein
MNFKYKVGDRLIPRGWEGTYSERIIIECSDSRIKYSVLPATANEVSHAFSFSIEEIDSMYTIDGSKRLKELIDEL